MYYLLIAYFDEVTAPSAPNPYESWGSFNSRFMGTRGFTNREFC